MSAPVVVAVVSWNTRELLARCLDSLRADADSGVAAVTVVDNGSADGSAELVESEYDWAELIRAPRNLGYGAAVNLAVAATPSEWIVAANADVELEPGALAGLLRAGGRDRAAGAIAPRLVLADGSTQHSVHSFPSVGLALAFNLGLGAAVPGLGERLCLEGRWDPERPRAVDWAHGALLLLRRHAFDAVGGFDPAQWMYAEDLDLCWRLHEAGWTTLYEPGARVGHALSAAASQAFGNERAERHMAAADDWLTRRRGRAVSAAYAAINAAGGAARLAALGPLARWRPERYGERAALESRYLRLHARALRPTGGRRSPSL